ncbi:hypothetical protein B0J12DRAFT_737321 [Macrophomina phaseolina]|uniref:DUF2293 domain-containing protein n=1 Tax=Macrophomina phaseolina TaxID=35725 RepID=A0ABQ8GJT6_9PEZI|nr:hypothetical protein B0J12DRAFT_737321 [Macrophomina phaseolina]
MLIRFLPTNPSRVHPPFVFHWKKPFFFLMAARPGRERDVHPRTPIRPGYVFVKKGDQYVTRHCRQLTLSAGHDLFKVVDDKNRTLGLRVPAEVHATVLAANDATKSARLAATATRDASALAAARSTLLRLFPATPPESVDAIVAHAFRKHSGRVGRVGNMSLEERVTLGVRAHVRHAHTQYEALMREGMNRDEARKEVAGELEEVIGQWRGLVVPAEGRRVSLRTMGAEEEGEELGPSRKGVGAVQKRQKRAASTPTKARKKNAMRKPVKRAGSGVRKTKPRGTAGRGGKKRL